MNDRVSDMKTRVWVAESHIAHAVQKARVLRKLPLFHTAAELKDIYLTKYAKWLAWNQREQIK